MIPIYMITSDHYWPSARVGMHLFNKYWSEWERVGVAGFAPPPFDLPENFDFISLGNQADYPVNKWSDAFLKMLDIIPHEIFVLLFDDYWIVQPVDVEMVQRLRDYMHQYPRILKIDLAGDRAGASPIRQLGRWGGVDLLLSDPASPYHMSLYVGMWRKSLLREVLIPGETPWQVEIEGTNRLREYMDDMQVVGTRNMPVKIALGHRHGDHTVTYLDGLPREDLDELGSLGYIDTTQALAA